jgi:WhiB family redox-sensing transcriptional regulator
MPIRHLGILTSEYVQLLAAIRAVGKVPCEWKPEYWFPEDIANPEQRVVAQTVALTGCRQCPIQEECFTYALESNQKHGIWGGSLPTDRI